jgi:hypothetical protein
MVAVEVEPNGLTAFAGHCMEQAARVGPTATPTVGGGFQPSAAAVRVADGDVAATEARLAARLNLTATTALAAAIEYSTTETASAAEVAAVV